MAKIVNLNKFRKQKQKVDDAKRADANSRLHGRTLTERERERTLREQFTSKLDGARLDKKDEEE